MLANVTMTKSLITTLFKIAIAFVIAGTVAFVGVVIAAIVNGAVVLGGAQLVTIDPGPFAAALVGATITSVLVGVGSAVAVAAWVGALLNTWRLEDKTWFVALLGLGLVSLGWLAMIAYVLRGPDSTAPVAADRATVA